MCTVAVVPIVPFMLWDYDLAADEDTPSAAWKLKRYIEEKCTKDLVHYHWKTRTTKHGLHLVVRCDTWDTVQAALYEMLNLTHKNSIMSCRKQRLRIVPKLDIHTGAILNPAPLDLDGCGHWAAVDIEHDRTLTRLEFYKTFERTKDTRQWTPEQLVLKSRGETIG